MWIIRPGIINTIPKCIGYRYILKGEIITAKATENMSPLSEIILTKKWRIIPMPIIITRNSSNTIDYHFLLAILPKNKICSLISRKHFQRVIDSQMSIRWYGKDSKISVLVIIELRVIAFFLAINHLE